MEYKTIVITKESDYDYYIHDKNDKLLGWIARSSLDKDFVFEADYDVTFDVKCFDEINIFLKSLIHTMSDYSI